MTTMRRRSQQTDGTTTTDVASREEVCRGAPLAASRARRPKTRGGRSRNGEIDDGKHRKCDHIFVVPRPSELAAGKLSADHFAARDWTLTMPAAVDTMSHFTSVFRSSRFIERSFKKSESSMEPMVASRLRAGTATMNSEEPCDPSVRLAWSSKTMSMRSYILACESLNACDVS